VAQLPLFSNLAWQRCPKRYPLSLQITTVSLRIFLPPPDTHTSEHMQGSMESSSGACALVSAFCSRFISQGIVTLVTAATQF